MKHVIPMGTALSLRSSAGGPGPFYRAQVLGQNRWGLILTLPSLQGQVAAFPAGTPLLCQYMEGSKLIEITTQVVGYEQRTPPVMIVAEPQARQEKNRRDALRFEIQLPVTYVVDGDQVTFSKSQTIDVSHTGLLLWAPRPLPMGATVSLALELPDFLLRTDSLVRRNIPRGFRAMVGVEFVKLRSLDAMQLHKFLVAMELERAKLSSPELQTT